MSNFQVFTDPGLTKHPGSQFELSCVVGNDLCVPEVALVRTTRTVRNFQIVIVRFEQKRQRVLSKIQLVLEETRGDITFPTKSNHRVEGLATLPVARDSSRRIQHSFSRPAVQSVPQALFFVLRGVCDGSAEMSMTMTMTIFTQSPTTVIGLPWQA